MEIGSIGIIAAVVFLVVFVGLAMIVFSFVRKTVKLAFRLAIVGVLLLIGIVGAASLWWFSGSGEKPPPAPIQKTR